MGMVLLSEKFFFPQTKEQALLDSAFLDVSFLSKLEGEEASLATVQEEASEVPVHSQPSYSQLSSQQSSQLGSTPLAKQTSLVGSTATVAEGGAATVEKELFVATQTKATPEGAATTGKIPEGVAARRAAKLARVISHAELASHNSTGDVWLGEIPIYVYIYIYISRSRSLSLPLSLSLSLALALSRSRSLSLSWNFKFPVIYTHYSTGDVCLGRFRYLFMYVYLFYSNMYIGLTQPGTDIERT